METDDFARQKDYAHFSDALQAALKFRQSGSLLCVLELMPATFSIVLYHQLDQVPLLVNEQIRLILT